MAGGTQVQGPATPPPQANPYSSGQMPMPPRQQSPIDPYSSGLSRFGNIGLYQPAPYVPKNYQPQALPPARPMAAPAAGLMETPIEPGANVPGSDGSRGGYGAPDANIDQGATGLMGSPGFSAPDSLDGPQAPSGWSMAGNVATGALTGGLPGLLSSAARTAIQYDQYGRARDAANVTSSPGYADSAAGMSFGGLGIGLGPGNDGSSEANSGPGGIDAGYGASEAGSGMGFNGGVGGVDGADAGGGWSPGHGADGGYGGGGK